MKIQCFALSLSVLLLSVAARGDNELDPESRKNSRVGEPTMLNSLLSAQDLLTKSKHLTAPTRPPTTLTQYAPQSSHGFYYSPYATTSPISSGYLVSMPAQHNNVIASESFSGYCPKFMQSGKTSYHHPTYFSERNANSPLGMNYGFQYVQLVPRPMVLPINPYSQYSSLPQPQPYLSHSQSQQAAASTHHHQTQSPQFLNSVPPTQQTAASMTIANPVNHHYVPYTPPLTQQQPVASYSNPMVSYFSPPPAARYHFAAHPQEMSLNTNEYMPGQLENGFRAIKRV